MNRSKLLEQLRAAKSAHIQWRASAQAMVNGLPIDETSVPVLHTDCNFGRWYYGAGQVLDNVPAFRAIDEEHEQLHMVYMKIFQTLYGDDHRSALSRFFGSNKHHEAAKLEKAKALLPELVEISKRLLSQIDLLEQDVRSMSEEDLGSLV